MARCLKAQVQRAPAHLGLRMCCRTPGNYLTHETLFPLVIDLFPLVIELLSGAVIKYYSCVISLNMVACQV